MQVDDSDSGLSDRASVPETAGMRLRAAREAAGLSIDLVASQLKLAPRQVQALEDDDFQRLPGRTFVRGFARNYARFLALDADSVIAMLPASESAPALQRPALAAARRPMGEMPIEGASKQSPARRLLPLLLIVAIAAAGYYEYTRQHPRDASSRSPSGDANAPLSQRPASGSSTALPNPVASSGGTTPAGADSPAPAAAASSSAATPASSTASSTTSATATTPVSPAPASVTTPTSPASTSPTASVATPTAPVTPPSPAPSSNATQATSTEATLVLTFKGTSWAEVKDASGRVILQMTGGAGMTQTVSGTAPFELALGNAPEVGVSFRGQALDLSPYTRGNVARVALR